MFLHAVRPRASWLALATLLTSLLVAAPSQAIGTSSVSGTAGPDGVSVSLYAAGSTTLVASTSSQQDGSFSVTGLEAGDYEVKFTKSGHVSRWFGGGEDRATADILSLAVGENSNIDVILDQAGVATGTVSVPGTTNSRRVYAVKLADGEWIPEDTPSVSTQAGGEFTYPLSTLQPVKFYVGASSDRPFPYWHGDAFSVQTAKAVLAPSGGTVAGVDIAVPGVAYVEGTLTNAFGGYLTGGVQAWVRDHGEVVQVDLTSVSTSSSMRTGFRIPVPAGSDVTLSGTGGAMFTTTYLGDVTSQSAATFVNLPAGDTRGALSIAVQDGNSISGRLVQAPFSTALGVGAPGVEVTAWFEDRLMSKSTTDSMGYYRLTGLSWGNTPNVEIRLAGGGIDQGWISGFTSISPDREAAWELSPYSFGPRVLDPLTVSYPQDARLTVTTPLQVVERHVIGKPLTALLPTWSNTPDRVEVYAGYDAGATWRPSELGVQTSGVVTVQPLSNAAHTLHLTAVAYKDGHQIGTSTTQTSVVPFAPLAAPLINGNPMPGQQLTVAAPYNVDPDRISYTWLRDGGFGVGSGPTYQVTDADVGHSLSVWVTGSYGTETSTNISAAVAVVPAPAPPLAPTPAPTLLAPTSESSTVAAPDRMRAPRVKVRGRRIVVTWTAATENGSPVTGYLVDISKGKDRLVSRNVRKTVFKGVKPGRYRLRTLARSATGTSPVSAWAKARVR